MIKLAVAISFIVAASAAHAGGPPGGNGGDPAGAGNPIGAGSNGFDGRDSDGFEGGGRGGGELAGPGRRRFARRPASIGMLGYVMPPVPDMWHIEAPVTGYGNEALWEDWDPPMAAYFGDTRLNSPGRDGQRHASLGEASLVPPK